MIGRTGTRMQETEDNRFARLFKLALIPAALGLAACAGKTAAVRPAAFFTSTPTRQATNAVDAGDGDLQIAALRSTVTKHPG